SSSAWFGWRLGQEPRQRLGHRPHQGYVLLVAEPVAGQDPQRGAEQGALGLVSDIAVLDLPRNQRGAAFGEIQDPLLGVIPCLDAIGLLEHAKRGSLGVTKTLHGG